MTVEPATLLFMHTDPSADVTKNFILAAEDLKKQILCVSSPLTLDKHIKRLVRFLGLVGPHISYKQEGQETKPEPVEESAEKKDPHRQEKEDFSEFHPLPRGMLYILERNEDRVVKYKWDGKSVTNEDTMTTEDVRNFYNDWAGGVLKPYYKSMPVSSIENEKDSLVKTLVGDNFDEVVYQSVKDVVVFFNSVWCLECNDIMEEYKKLAERFAKYNDVVFTKLDSFHNEGEFIPEGIVGEPVLRVFKSGSGRGEGVAFEGVYVRKELEKFIAQ